MNVVGYGCHAQILKYTQYTQNMLKILCSSIVAQNLHAMDCVATSCSFFTVDGYPFAIFLTSATNGYF